MKNQVLTMAQWQTRVSDVFSVIVHSRMYSADAFEYTEKHIYTELRRRTKTRAAYPAYIHGYVQGLIDAQRASIFRNHLEFCFLLDGVLYTTSRVDTGKPKSRDRDGADFLNVPAAHYWMGTDKQYTGPNYPAADANKGSY